jgi:hypothetical protein
MTRRCLQTVSIVAALVLCAVTSATADSLIEVLPKPPQVRTTDHRINAAVERGLRDSPTFRGLVDRINASNVVVYVTADAGAMPQGLDGQLTFVSSAGGFRYVLVRVKTALAAARLVSLLGHELQHAREIADSEAIVDAPSMAREYTARLGYCTRRRAAGNMFDSRAAVQAGERVLRELLTGE